MSRVSDYAGSDPKFLAWMKKVDAFVSRKVGVSVMDLPDADFASMFEDGVSPSAAAKAAIADA